MAKPKKAFTYSFFFPDLCIIKVGIGNGSQILDNYSLHNKNNQNTLKNNSWGYPLPVWYPMWVRIFWGNQVSPRQWLERAGFAVSWAWKLCCLFSCWWSAPRWRCLKIWKVIEKSVNFETCPKQNLGCCYKMSIPLKILVDDPRWSIFNLSSSQTKRHNITQGWPPYGHKLGYNPSYAFLFGHL